MSRRNRQDQADSAAMEASEAGRVLQAQRQTEAVDPPAESPQQPQINTPAPPLRNEPRRLAMEEIEQAHLERLGAKEAEPEPVATPEPPVPTPDDMLKGGKFSEAPAPAAATVEPPEPVKTVRVKVDGREFDVPQAVVDEAGGVGPYQRIKAADNRLAKVNQTLAETRQAQALLFQHIQAQQQPKQPQQTHDEFLQSKMDVIRFGTPQESAAALREVIERSNPRIDQNAITNAAVNQMQQNHAVGTFQQEFADVVSNPLLLKLATTLETERLAITRQAGQTPVWTNFYRQIGHEVRSAISRSSQPAVAPQTAGTPSLVSSDKEARKASIVNLPQASARAELPKESKPETREDVLTQMRRSRGIPTG